MQKILIPTYVCEYMCMRPEKKTSFAISDNTERERYIYIFIT